jgi:predicted ATPase
VVEDAHWVDPTSLDFMSLLVERASSMRLLLVIVARPEFVPPWPEYSYMTALACRV